MQDIIAASPIFLELLRSCGKGSTSVFQHHGEYFSCMWLIFLTTLAGVMVDVSLLVSKDLSDMCQPQ